MRLAAAAILGLIPAGAASARYSVTTFSLPQAAPICGTAISSTGVVVGNKTGTGTPLAFEYRNKNFIFPKPELPAGRVSFTGINRALTITGTDLITGAPLSLHSEGFTMRNGVTSVLSLPNAADTAITGITDSGTLIGYYDTSASAIAYGFVQRPGMMTTLQAAANASTIPLGVSPDGSAVVGVYLPASGPQNGLEIGFLYANGGYTTLAYPHAIGTTANGVYGDLWVAGSYFTGTAPKLVAHGYLYKAGKYYPFEVPGAASTQIGGANARGQLTGCITTKAGRTLGFIATP